MFSFTIKNSDFLNEFYSLFKDYLNKSYKYSMTYLSNPLLSEYNDNERLVLIVLNKSVYQNMLSFLKLNDNNMQFASLSCLENAVNTIRLYNVLVHSDTNLHSFITEDVFSLEECENKISEETKEYKENFEEEFSLKEFSLALHKLNSFEYKNTVFSSQINDGNIYLGLACSVDLSDSLQDEVRKNLIGAYLSLQKHTKMFFNGGVDESFEETEDKIYQKFLEYIKIYSK